MAAIDEIDALEKGIREIESTVSTHRHRIINTEKQLKDARDGGQRASELADLMRSRLKEMKASDVVNMLDFAGTRLLYHRNIDLAASKRQLVQNLIKSIKSLKVALPELESQLGALTRQRGDYNIVLPIGSNV